MSRRRPKGRVPGTYGKPVSAKLEQRQMIRGAGGALYQLRQEQQQRAAEGRPMSKLEVLDREQEIVRRSHQLYRARVAPLTGETIALDAGFEA